ncbi:hypothetical protein CR983_01700 [Candidatus Saccharibacteria bacterium]|nr:MAG: hypothetical protein CR983_01700 [Candidatus Saccharibacteria bacterium]
MGMEKLPETLLLMRHGRTLANDVYSARRKGRPVDHKLESQIRSMPDWKQTLSERGERQARSGRVWIERNMGGVATFDALWTSPFLRARQTAALLTEGTSSAWRIDDMLSEQTYGELANIMAVREAKRRIRKADGQSSESLWSAPYPGGENHIQLQLRFREFFRERIAESSSDRALIVAHSGLINVARYYIESMRPEQFDELEKQDHGDITNGSMLLYTRVNPDRSDDTRSSYSWKRLLQPKEDGCQEEDTHTDSGWEHFSSVPAYTSADLLRQVSLLE